MTVMAALTVTACPGTDLPVLYGEDPEIGQLLEKPMPANVRTSAVAAARRLHQAIMQNDGEMTWALLATKTRRALDARGALIGTSGRELIDAGTLPTSQGSVLKVRYGTIFFGPSIIGLRTAPKKDQRAKRRVLLAKSKKGQITELNFVLEEDGWKLEKLEF